MKKKYLLVFVVAALACLAFGGRANVVAAGGCTVTDDGGVVLPERCAHLIYTAGGSIKDDCEKKQYDSIISRYFTVTTNNSGTVDKYVGEVCKLFINNINVDPCNSWRNIEGNTTGYEQCKNGNKKYYYDDPDYTPNRKLTPDDDSEKSSTNKTVNSGDCTSILPSTWCGANGITNIIHLIKDILTGLVVVAGTIGIIVCGVMWMTARDNEAQVATAKRRIFEIVIGLVAWILLYAFMNLLIPSNTDVTNIDNAGQTSSNK